MTDFLETVENMRRDISYRISDDKFNSYRIRQVIIDKIAGVRLPATPVSEIHDKLSGDEKIKIDYLSRCAALGAGICMDLLKKSFSAKFCCYHQYILAGAAHIGREIGVEYAQILYPELRNMRALGIAHEIPVCEPEITIESYGFTVHRYDDLSFELGNTRPLPHPPQFELFYDDVNERYIEQYSFPDWEQADHARNTWECFINGKEARPPVRYGFDIIDDPAAEKTVHAVIPLNKDASDSIDVTSDGRQREFKVYNTLEEALRHNRKALDSVPQTSIIPALPKIIFEEKTHPGQNSKIKNIPTSIIPPLNSKRTKKALEK